MRVKMLVELSGTRNGQPWPPRGQVVDLPDDEAAHYCAAGMATPVATRGADVETATPPPDAEKRAASPTTVTTANGPTAKGRRTRR